MQFTTVLKVPSSPNSILLNNLIKSEEKLALITGYNVKLVEQSGLQLSRLFQRVFTADRCHLTNCPTCKEFNGKGSSRCRINNVMYEAVCLTCDIQHKNGHREKKR